MALSIMVAKPAIVTPASGSLAWEDSISNMDEKMTHSEAIEYCNTLTLGGFDDWRLPRLDELLSIVDFTRYRPATIKVFEYVDSDTLYWSSSAYAGEKRNFWGVDFKDGSTSHASSIYDRFVRCTRDLK